MTGRGSRIRTCGLKYPKLPRYRAALYPVNRGVANMGGARGQPRFVNCAPLYETTFGARSRGYFRRSNVIAIRMKRLNAPAIPYVRRSTPPKERRRKT